MEKWSRLVHKMRRLEKIEVMQSEVIYCNMTAIYTLQTTEEATLLDAYIRQCIYGFNSV